jgi:hypothetical protein
VYEDAREKVEVCPEKAFSRIFRYRTPKSKTKKQFISSITGEQDKEEISNPMTANQTAPIRILSPNIARAPSQRRCFV